jgi:hypothetical protein
MGDAEQLHLSPDRTLKPVIFTCLQQVAGSNCGFEVYAMFYVKKEG